MKTGIYGYGNLGKGVEKALLSRTDTEITGIYTRREPEQIGKTTSSPVYPADEVFHHKNDTDVLIVCGGSAEDLPRQTPMLAASFNVVDSFDTHEKVGEHFTKVNESAMQGKTTALIAAGWDPGLFSLFRSYADSILPEGKTYTFWGKGVSQGHSDAIRRLNGVTDARQYTVPSEKAMNAVRQGAVPSLSKEELHRRECFVSIEEGADKAEIEKQVKNMPFYFKGYETSVCFISEKEMEEKHASLSHGGTVIRNGRTGTCDQSMEFSLRLGSNPLFTGSILAAFALAVFRMNQRGETGCKTVFDIAPADLSPYTAEELRTKFL